MVRSIENKLKIIRLHAEVSKIGMRKFTDLVETEVSLTALICDNVYFLITKINLS